MKDSDYGAVEEDHGRVSAMDGKPIPDGGLGKDIEDAGGYNPPGVSMNTVTGLLGAVTAGTGGMVYLDGSQNVVGYASGEVMGAAIAAAGAATLSWAAARKILD